MTKLFGNRGGQVFLNIPKKLAWALQWSAGTEVSIEIMGKDKIKIEKIRGKNDNMDVQ